ncbi:MAG: hypothetical protein ABEN55_04165 [Bradymonadaceae bacterium]
MKKEAADIGEGDTIEVRGSTYVVDDAHWSDDHRRIVVEFEGSPARLKYEPDALIDVVE